MKHKEFENSIVDYLEGTLKGAKKREFEVHMIECNNCLEKLSTQDSILSILEEKSVEGFLAEHGIDFFKLVETKLKKEGNFDKFKKILDHIKKGYHKEQLTVVPIKPKKISKLTELDKFFQKLKQFIEFPVSAPQQRDAIMQSFGKIEDFLSGALNKTNQGFINEILQMRIFNRDEKAILEMSLFKNMKTGEIARKLNEYPKVISRKKSRALKKLQNEFIEIYEKKK